MSPVPLRRLNAGWKRNQLSSRATAAGATPRPSAAVSLEPVADAIRRAKSSVLYAIMAFGTGTGPVLEALRDLTADSGVFWFGMRQSSSGVSVVKPNRNVGQFADFAFLKDQVDRKSTRLNSSHLVIS